MNGSLESASASLRGDSVVGQRPCVDYDTIGVLSLCLDAVHDCALVIGLKELDQHVQVLRLLLDEVFDVGESLDAVVSRLALAEVVQVRAVNNQYFHILFPDSAILLRGCR